MKKIFYLAVAALLVVAAAPRETPADVQLKGTWKIIRSQYGDDPMKDREKDDVTYKMFTGTRWSGIFYNSTTKAIGGSCGGTYTINGSQYAETVEYYSWDADVVGKTFTFNMTFENGMLHQKGTMEYKGNKNYMIDEWYVRVD